MEEGVEIEVEGCAVAEAFRGGRLGGGVGGREIWSDKRYALVFGELAVVVVDAATENGACRHPEKVRGKADKVEEVEVERKKVIVVTFCNAGLISGLWGSHHAIDATSMS